MRNLRTLGLVAASLLAGALVACGGGGHGYGVAMDPLLITSTSIGEMPTATDPNALYESSDAVDFEIPLSGGCGGPYVLSVIQGQLPSGIALVDGRDAVTGENLHHLRGTLLEDGEFSFRLQVIDRSCEPFQSTHADFDWSVVRGHVSIVGAIPALFAPGTQVRLGEVLNPVYAALAPTVYNEFTSIQFVVAGGLPPYSLEVVDDPTNPDDGDLPTGISIPATSTSLVGAPAAVKEGGAPFVMTFQATDSLGQSGRLTVQWQIDTPAIILANGDLPDGKAGTSYTETLVVIDGVPPFQFEFVRCDVDRDAEGAPAVVWGTPPTITPACCLERISAADYPAQDLLGPDYRSFMTPPEGIFLGDVPGNPRAAAGTITGIPRRRGDFRVVVHVKSSLLPNERGQQQWALYEFSIAPSEPPTTPKPAFGQDPAYTMTGAFSASPPYAEIAEALVGQTYNPDASTYPALGLQLLARGGVRKDGLTDAPHASEVLVIEGTGADQEDSTTAGGGYDWTLDPNPPGDGDQFTTTPPGMALAGSTGVWAATDVNALVKQGRQCLEFTVMDQHLPSQLRNSRAERVWFSVGPDKMILTQSSTSDTSLTINGSTNSMHDLSQTVRAVDLASGAVSVRDLTSSDLAKTTVVPATTNLTGSTALATLLKNTDLCATSVNPSGWWDDVYGLNANAARPMQHGDPNRYVGYYNSHYGGSTYWYGWRPSTQAVDLPAVTSSVVAHDPANGVYKDGGKFYAFGNSSYFGVMIVRRDAQVYVPCAFDRSTYQCFGDAWVVASSYTYAFPAFRSPQLTVSPDGRFGAFKLRRSETSFYETASTTDIVIFSLTGEKSFGGKTYKVITSGSAGSSSTGTYLYGTSLTLTNGHLYYMCGNWTGSDYVQGGYCYMYRYEIADATGAVTASASAGALLTSATGDSTWTNTAGSYGLQVPWQCWSTPQNGTDLYYDGCSMPENATARGPFRVSRDGKACVILAGPATAYPYDYSQDAGSFHVWVDYAGGNVRRLSTTKRRMAGGASRGYTLTRGPSSYPNYGAYTGPTTQLEISDDATKVAVVVNRYTGYMYPYYEYGYMYSSREDVIAYTTSNNWGSASELFVTGPDSGSAVFAGSTCWRFGALVFTKDNKGLVFWGGSSSWNAYGYDSTFMQSYQYCGTFYGCDLVGSPGTVTSLLATADGGGPDGVKNYTSSSPMSPSSIPSGDYGSSYTYSAVYGVIKPYGGFLSKNREFFYLVNDGALNGSNATNLRLVGVNVRSTNSSQNVNGNLDFRAFAVANWPTGRSFQPYYYYYPYYTIGYYYYARTYGGGLQAMAKDSGRVFFGSHYMYYSGYYNTYYYYGGPVYPSTDGNYGTYSGEIEMFDADKGGPIQRVSSLGGDDYPNTYPNYYRRIHFVEPNAAGDEVSWVLDQYPSTAFGFSYEKLYYAGNIQLGANGALTTTPTRIAAEATQGRAGESLSFGFLPRKYYYAFRAGASDENQKDLVEAVVNPATGTQTTRVLVSGSRFNVLHVGR